MCFTAEKAYSSNSTNSIPSDIKHKQPSEMFYKKGVLEYFIKFIGKHQCQSLFFNKEAGLRFMEIVSNFMYDLFIGFEI